jgi:calcineurin-like phosphoesterase family protein
MSNIYFTSDTHFGHANISGKNESKWPSGYRHYSSLHEMNKDLTTNINKLVKPDDVLYHLGDWSFGGINNIWKFRKQIMCQNIHLILGNHDHHIEENKILPNVVGESNNPGYFISTGDLGFNHDHTIPVNAKDLFASVSHYKEVKINGRMFVLSHYGHRVWHGSHKGWIHLYGHSHDSLPAYGKSMDCGIDTAIRILGTARPFALNEILDIMDKQPLEFPDHHDLKTNTGKPQGSKGRNHV